MVAMTHSHRRYPRALSQLYGGDVLAIYFLPSSEGRGGSKAELCLDGWFCEQLYILLYGSSAVALYSPVATKQGGLSVSTLPQLCN